MRARAIPFLFSLLFLCASPAVSATIHIPADQPTIQAGIDAAGEGDRILVSPGTYLENIDFTGKAISIVGEGGTEETIIDGGAAGPVVTFQGRSRGRR